MVMNANNYRWPARQYDGMLMWTLLIPVLLVQCSANYTTEELESFLNNLYIGKEHRRGCETPIKCTYPHDAVMINATGNESDASCCYDCDNCVGDRCYRGWQCCRDSGQGQHSFVDDSLLYYTDVPQEYVRCEKLFHYEKTYYGTYIFETGVFETDHVNDNRDRSPVTYQMISTCPPQFTDSEIVNLCENAVRLGSVLNLIPFISKSKKHLYKNRYCVQCHNGYTFENSDDRFVPLNLLLSAEGFYYKYPFISMFETVYDVMNFTVPLDSYEIESDLRIVLQASVRLLNIGEFEVQTIPPCGINISKDTECTDVYGYNNSLLRDACKTFYSPIRVHSGSDIVIVRNLACARCRGNFYDTGPFSKMDRGYKGPDVAPCTTELAPGPSIVMNIQPAFDVLSAPSEDIRHQRLVGVVRDKRDGIHCESGLFWDAITRKCRRILCPRRHYIYHGKCEPIYKETSRHTYYVKIKVTPKNHRAVIKEDLIRRQEEQLMSVIENRTSMGLCFRRTLMKARSETHVGYVIYTFAYVPFSRSSYRSALFKWKFIFDLSLQGILMKTTSLFDNYHIGVGDILHYNLLDPTTMNPIPSDSIDGKPLSVVVHEGTGWYIIKHCGGLIDISKQDFCYRIGLEPEEYKIDSVNSIPRLNVNATGKIIYRDNYDILLDGSARICIEDYEKQSEAGLDRRQTKVTKNNIPDNNSGLGVNTVFGIIAAAIFAFIAIAAIISRSQSISQWCKDGTSG